jgi:hypothetical protein
MSRHPNAGAEVQRISTMLRQQRRVRRDLLSLRVFHFEQTHPAMCDSFSARVPKNDTYKDYVLYAEHCLNMMAGTTDKESRRIQREMAAEWLRLADAIRRPHRFKQMQMG